VTVTAAETPQEQFTGDGTTTAFTVTNFDVLDFEYIRVWVWDNTAANDGVEQHRHVDYRVSGTLAAPVITFNAAPTNAYTITAERHTPLRQLIDYQANVPFLMDTHERGFDYLTHILAEINFRLGRVYNADIEFGPFDETGPWSGRYFHEVFPAAITGPIASSEYPFSEVKWDEAGSQWLAKTGGYSGNAREFNGCGLVDPWRVVLMFRARIDTAATDVDFRFLMPSDKCTSYACCFGAGGYERPGSGGGDTGSDGSAGPATADPTTGVAITIPGTPNWTPVRRCGDDTATGEYVESGNIPIVGTYWVRDGECFYVNPFDTGTLNQATSPGTEIATAQTSITGCTDANCVITANDCDAGVGKCTSVNWIAWVAGGDWCSDGPEPDRSYTIVGWTNNLIGVGGACAACDAKVDDTWDGKFEAKNVAVCEWLGEDANGDKSYNGKSMGVSTKIKFNSGTPDFTLTVDCFESPSAGHVSWVGAKAYGRTPGGVYTRTGGCAATPATITVA
jgi:hypothetical protein